MLYDQDDQETIVCKNPACKLPRNNLDGTPVRTMKMFSISKIVALWLSNENTRQLMTYRDNYQRKNNSYEDYYDGEEYQRLIQMGCFQSPSDVAISLFVDGFTATKSNQSSKMTIVHLVNMNLPPSLRYKDTYTRQLAILPGPNNPGSLLETFLKPIVNEAEKLSQDGLVVVKNGVTVCKARVYIVMATGDLPAAGQVSQH